MRGGCAEQGAKMPHTIEERFRKAVASFLAERFGSGGGRRVLAAVSGGADSVFLLALLESLCREMGFLVAAVTVNHGLRPNGEGAADAGFVQAMCASFKPAVECFRVDLAAGEVEREAARRKMGMEEAARFLRYRAFERAGGEWGADCVMTAHTATDSVETALMRFLQGAARGGGIRPARTCGGGTLIFRPMLSLSGEEVRSFLKEKGIPWREDSSNADARFLRNRIRLRALPFLDAEFPGWREAVLCGAEKSALAAELVGSLPLPEWRPFPPGAARQDEGGAALIFYCKAEEYSALLPALRLRFLYGGANLLGMEGRIPYRLLRQAALADGGGRASGAGFFFELTRRYAFLGRDAALDQNGGYCVEVRGEGRVDLPLVRLRARRAGAGAALAVESACGERARMAFEPPFVLRSRRAGDRIAIRGGKHKSLKKLFNEWGVPPFLRMAVPVVETGGGVAAVLGSPLGFRDIKADI